MMDAVDNDKNLSKPKDGILNAIQFFAFQATYAAYHPIGRHAPLVHPSPHHPNQKFDLAYVGKWLTSRTGIVYQPEKVREMMDTVDGTPDGTLSGLEFLNFRAKYSNGLVLPRYPFFPAQSHYGAGGY